MTTTREARIAGGAWLVTVGLALAAAPLIVITREVPIDLFGVRGLDLVIAVDFATIGVLITRRRPQNPVGWLFSTVGLLGALQSFDAEFATYSVVEHDASLPLTTLLGWAQTWTWVPMLTALLLGLMLFPTGRLVSRRWRAGVALLGAAAVAFSVGIAVEPGRLEEVAGGLQNPYGLSKRLAEILIAIGGLLFITAVAVTLASLVVRYRRARGDEREQIRWLTLALSLLFASLLATIPGAITFESIGRIEAILVLVSFGGVAIAAGIAILRYRLYDIEIVINRAVVFSVLAGFISIVYVGMIIGVGALVGTRGGSNVVLPIAATALVAIAFQPVRQRAHELANRLVFGKRATPYEALAGLSGARSVEELVSRVARLAADSTAARRAVVWLSTGAELRPAASWPAEGLIPPPVLLRNGEPPSVPGEHRYSLIHHGDLLGGVTIAMGPGETLPTGDHQLLSDLAAHAAVALRGVLEAVELPTGTVTFLMTDIEGSTRLWEEDPTSMARALAEHDALIREIVREHGGVLIKSRGEGDSTFSVFEEAPNALAAVAEIQRRIGDHRWPTPRPIRIRASLHTGEAELRERDYFGPVVNRCARLRSIARSGQTVVSAITQAVVGRRLPENATLVDLGAHELKDLADPERVYELRLG